MITDLHDCKWCGDMFCGHCCDDAKQEFCDECFYDIVGGEPIDVGEDEDEDEEDIN